ncbi:hypothetical protein D3C72_1574510 [compost metagenome]
MEERRRNDLAFVGIAPAGASATSQLAQYNTPHAQIGGPRRTRGRSDLLRGFIVGKKERRLRFLELDLLCHTGQPRNVAQHGNHRDDACKTAPRILLAEGEVGHHGVLRFIASALFHRAIGAQHACILQFALADRALQAARAVHHAKTAALLHQQAHQRHRRRWQVGSAGHHIAARVLQQGHGGNRRVAALQAGMGVLRACRPGRARYLRPAFAQFGLLFAASRQCQRRSHGNRCPYRACLGVMHASPLQIMSP